MYLTFTRPGQNPSKTDFCLLSNQKISRELELKSFDASYSYTKILLIEHYDFSI